jgi:hypothetical protein
MVKLTGWPAMTLLLVQGGSWHHELARRSMGCSIITLLWPLPRGQLGREEVPKPYSSPSPCSFFTTHCAPHFLLLATLQLWMNTIPF